MTPIRPGVQPRRDRGRYPKDPGRCDRRGQQCQPRGGWRAFHHEQARRKTNGPVNVDGAGIEYEVTREGRPVVLHGFPTPARSSSLSTPSGPRRRRSAFTQLPSVPALIPRSRATCAIGLPVSRTSRTPPGNPDRTSCVSASAPPFKAMSPRYEGKPTGAVQGEIRCRKPGAPPQLHRAGSSVRQSG